MYVTAEWPENWIDLPEISCLEYRLNGASSKGVKMFISPPQGIHAIIFLFILGIKELAK